MNNRLDDIHEMVTQTRVDIGGIKEILASQAKVLEAHSARTRVCEGRLDKLEVPYKVLVFLGIPLGVLAAIGQIVKLLLG